MENYIRDGRGSTLVMRAEEAEEPSYQMEMLRKSRPDRLLPVQICAINDQREYHYEAGGLMPLSEFLEKRTITFKMLKQFIDSIRCVLTSVEEYLLEVDRLCMEPEHIYTEEKDNRLSFCYGPRAGGFEKGLLKLLQFFLEKLDYEDKQGVTMAYQVYQNVMKEGYNSALTCKIIDEQPKAPEVVFPWEEDTEEERREEKEPPVGKWQERKPEQQEKRPEKRLEKRPEKKQAKQSKKQLQPMQLGIYAAGGIVCGVAAGVCYWCKSLLACGIALLTVVVAFSLLIYFGRQYKGIDSSRNT